MVMLTPDELAALRDDMAALMPETCVISRATETTDSAGFVTRTHAPVGTAICRLDPAGRVGTRDVIALRETLAMYRQLTVPHVTDIRAGDRVTVAGRDYEIIQLDDDHSLRAVRRATIVEG